jgi:putative redox protein
MATVIKIKNLPEGYQSIITNGTHSIVGDEPIKSNGTDLGMSPSELVLSGLALCKVATIRHIARQKGWEIGEVKAELSQEVKRSPDGLKSKIKVAMQIEGNLSPDQKEELIRQADACYIHRQIMGEWDIEHATDLDLVEAFN